MNRLVTALITCAILYGCSTAPRAPDAVDDFVATSELETVDKVKPTDHDDWSPLTDRYIIYRSREQDYLFNFRARCPALYNRAFMRPDHRYESALRARVDTISGCLIGEMYLLTPQQVNELENLGKPPGQS
jgi:hypothetical protein